LDAGADAFKNPPPCSEIERPKSNLTLATKIQEEPTYEYPISAGNSVHTLYDLIVFELDNARLNDPEVCYLAIGLLHYIDKGSTWKNRHGEIISIERILHRLMDDDFVEMGCYGTHSLYAVSMAMRKSRKLGLSDRCKITAERFLQENCKLLVASQLDDGSWQADWRRPASTSHPLKREKVEQVLTTSHHLEWLAMTGLDQMPDIRAATSFLRKELLQSSNTEISQNYSAFSHAANALSVWFGKNPS